jgi:hypothetical protein
VKPNALRQLGFCVEMALHGIRDLLLQLTQIMPLRSDAASLWIIPGSYKQARVLAGGYLKTISSIA